ncbi:GmrSD restriction endonuclease domain-containing protein [Akkermansia sp. AKK6]
MGLLFDRNTKTVKYIFEEFDKGRLIVDSSYQRRKVWLQPDKIRLIETILLDLIIPEVFFWPSSIDSDTGEMVTHIVDGQQRITAIVEFLNNEYPLNKKYLTDPAVIKRVGGKKFEELISEEKNKLWLYKMSIVDIDSTFTKENITQMFNRLNLTNYSLNSQEKRNSQSSMFGDKATELSNFEFWKKYKVFSALDARRMKDVEYCCSMYILANEGVVDQTNDRKINDYYKDFANSFDQEEKLISKIKRGMDLIEKICDKTTLSFVSKKAQMYTLFSFAFKLDDEQIDYTLTIFEKFKLFVFAYNLFKNEYNFENNDASVMEIHNMIKKYKLASSEGVNKIKNRVIRLQTLYSICIEDHSDTKEKLKELIKIYEEAKSAATIEYEDFENDDIIDISES